MGPFSLEQRKIYWNNNYFREKNQNTQKVQKNALKKKDSIKQPGD